jgi:hypothetical protein
LTLVSLVWHTERVLSLSIVGLCLVPPVWAWRVEVRQERRLARRIAAIPAGAFTGRHPHNGGAA